MPDPIKLFDVVALTTDIPTKGLVRGQMGTIVEVHDPSHFEVEFVNRSGKTYALLPLSSDQLMVLHEEQVASNR